MIKSTTGSSTNLLVCLRMQAWMIKLKNIDAKQLDKLLDAAAYTKQVESIKH